MGQIYIFFISLFFLNFLGCYIPAGIVRNPADLQTVDEIRGQDIDFGATHVGEVKVLPLILKNQAAKNARNVTLRARSMASLFTIKNPDDCQEIPSKTSCTINVEFAPTAVLNAFSEDIAISYELNGLGKSFTVSLKADTTLADLKTPLDTLLRSRPFDSGPITGLKTGATTAMPSAIAFKLDKKGHLIKVDVKKEVDIVSSYPGRYTITDPHPPQANLPFPSLYVDKGGNMKIFNDFDDIVKVQREYGIYSIKTLYPECYYAYAHERFKGKYIFERLYALERAANPRPLVFKDDQQWQDFQNELKNIFKDFKGPDSYIVILGTSTTFFSRNPKKGKNKALFEPAPQCIASAKDAMRTKDVYTFDTPGAPPSDVDIHVFIPDLSALCEQAAVGGNTGDRDTYTQNSLGACFNQGTAPVSVQAMVDKTKGFNSNNNPWKHGSDFYNFMVKFEKLLDNRELNFSVHIRPDQLAAPKTVPGVKTFMQDPNLKTTFVIPIN